MKRSIYFILVLAIWVAGCVGSAKTTSDVAVLPTAAPLPHAMKGYELYSWQVEGQWHFTLITGTNREKELEEIISDENGVTPDGWVRISVQGVDAVQRLLSGLPPGEEIFWLVLRSGPPFVISLPPQEIIDTVKAICAQWGLTLHVSE